MKVTKKISRQGSIILPKTVRDEAGIPLGTAVDIETDGEHIIIGKHVPVCCFCGSPEEVFAVLGIEICQGCAEKINRKAGIHHGKR